jgi:hypothetical protein
MERMAFRKSVPICVECNARLTAQARTIQKQQDEIAKAVVRNAMVDTERRFVEASEKADALLSQLDLSPSEMARARMLSSRLVQFLFNEGIITECCNQKYRFRTLKGSLAWALCYFEEGTSGSGVP